MLIYMANIFGKKDIKNNPHRSGFNLDARRLHTSKVGSILPVWWTLAIPGDKFSIDLDWFTRSVAVNTAAYTRIKEYYDFYAVPLRLLWRQGPEALMSLQDNATTASSSTTSTTVGTKIPYMTLSELSACLTATSGSSSGTSRWGDTPDIFGYKKGDLAMCLLRNLGYGNIYASPTASGTPNYGTQLPTAQFSQAASVNTEVSLLPLLAYQKVIDDYYRVDQWENRRAWTYNVDYFDGTTSLGQQLISQFKQSDPQFRTFLSVAYANWNKDRLMGVMPNSQLGDPSVVNVSGGNAGVPLSATLTGGSFTSPTATLALAQKLARINVYRGDWSDDTNMATFVGNQDAQPDNLGKGVGPVDHMDNPHNGMSSGFVYGTRSSLDYQMVADLHPMSNATVNFNGTPTWQNVNMTFNSDVAMGSFSVLQLRLAEALQRHNEISQTGDLTFSDQVYKHFGVRPSATEAGLSRYLGGTDAWVKINPVVNQNLTDGNGADIQGVGVGAGTYKGKIRFKSDDYYVLICLHHLKPIQDYALSGQHALLNAVDVLDYPIPEFDNIGFEGVPLQDFTQKVFASTPFGYNLRYSAWKGDLDTISGAFLTTQKDWVAPINDSNLFASTYNGIDYKFFKVDPAILNPIFMKQADGTWDTDTFFSQSEFRVRVARNLSRLGIPNH